MNFNYQRFFSILAFAVLVAQGSLSAAAQSSPLAALLAGKVHADGREDQEDIDNWRNAVRYVEQNIVGNLQNLTVETIKTTHKLLGGSEARIGADGGSAGVFRDRDGIVGRENISTIFDNIGKYLNNEEQEYFQALQLRLQVFCIKCPHLQGLELSTLIDRNEIPAEELAALKKLFFVPISPARIQPALEALCKTVHAMVLGGYDPVKIASLVIMKIFQIHPFAFGNGRLGRLLMNAVLVTYRLPVVEFSNEAEYLDAVRAGDQNLENFTKYLRIFIS
ncbi:Fic family protein [Candidatus Babeliales bacterium]|nr:Fic family protein [Candidatus Babeliales bacterium]